MIYYYIRRLFSECTEVRCKRNVVDRHNAAGFVLLSKSVFVFFKFFFVTLLFFGASAIDWIGRMQTDLSIVSSSVYKQTSLLVPLSDRSPTTVHQAERLWKSVRWWSQTMQRSAGSGMLRTSPLFAGLRRSAYLVRAAGRCWCKTT